MMLWERFKKDKLEAGEIYWLAGDAPDMNMESGSVRSLDKIYFVTLVEIILTDDGLIESPMINGVLPFRYEFKWMSKFNIPLHPDYPTNNASITPLMDSMHDSWR